MWDTPFCFLRATVRLKHKSRNRSSKGISKLLCSIAQFLSHRPTPFLACKSLFDCKSIKACLVVHTTTLGKGPRLKMDHKQKGHRNDRLRRRRKPPSSRRYRETTDRGAVFCRTRGAEKNKVRQLAKITTVQTSVLTANPATTTSWSKRLECLGTMRGQMGGTSCTPHSRNEMR